MHADLLYSGSGQEGSPQANHCMEGRPLRAGLGLVGRDYMGDRGPGLGQLLSTVQVCQR